MKKLHEHSGVYAIKHPKTLTDAKSEIDALRKSQGLAPLEPKPKTLSAARDILAGMRKPSKPSVKQAVATVAKAISAKTGNLASLEDIQAQLDAATGSNRVKLLNEHAQSYLVAAQSARAEGNYTGELEILRARQRLTNRAAHELFALPAAEREAVERLSRIPAI